MTPEREGGVGHLTYDEAVSRVDTASRLIVATPETVFAALVDADALSCWLPPPGMDGRFEHLRTEQRTNLVRNSNRVDEDQPLAVIDCIGRHRPLPLGMRRGPVVHALR
jgi:hypothetical protein